jgi:hypothetical protein
MSAMWPRPVLCCYADGCGYVQARGSGIPMVCPAHGTVLSMVLVEPAAFDRPDVPTAAPLGEKGQRPA